MQKNLMAVLPCLALLLPSVHTHAQVRSSQGYSDWTLSCGEFFAIQYEVLSDENLPRAAQLGLVSFFETKVKEDCSNKILS